MLVAIKAKKALLCRRETRTKTYAAKDQRNKDMPLHDFKSINHKGHEDSRSKIREQGCLLFSACSAISAVKGFADAAQVSKHSIKSEQIFMRDSETLKA